VPRLPACRGYRRAAASAARIFAAPAGVPVGPENGPYGAPEAGLPESCRQLSASEPVSTAS